MSFGDVQRLRAFALVLDALGAAEAALEDARGGRSRVRLAAFTSALSSFVPPAVRDLRRAHADVVVQVLQLETQEAIDRLRGGDADLAVVHHMPGVAVPDTAGLRRCRSSCRAATPQPGASGRWSSTSARRRDSPRA